MVGQENLDVQTPRSVKRFFSVPALNPRGPSRKPTAARQYAFQIQYLFFT
jgi:hypothetical protein